MIHFQSLRIACITAAICVPGVIGCSSDDGHGPVIGAPTTPVVISEGGSAPNGGSANPSGGVAGTDTGGGAVGVAGTINSGTAGSTDPFGTGGSSGGTDPFGTGNSNGGTDPFGSSDPFGTSGSSSAGTINSFSGSTF